MDNYYTEIVRSRRGTSNVAETEPSQGLDLWLLGRGLRIGNIFSLAFPLSAQAKHYAVFTIANKLDLTPTLPQLVLFSSSVYVPLTSFLFYRESY